jgi:hypothetical protein
MGLGESIGVQFFGIECHWREPVDCLKVVLDYFWGFGGAFNFDFGGTDDFHYRDPLVSM